MNKFDCGIQYFGAFMPKSIFLHTHIKENEYKHISAKYISVWPTNTSVSSLAELAGYGALGLANCNLPFVEQYFIPPEVSHCSSSPVDPTTKRKWSLSTVK